MSIITSGADGGPFFTQTSNLVYPNVTLVSL
jgi:hypothetical protein